MVQPVCSSADRLRTIPAPTNPQISHAVDPWSWHARAQPTESGRASAPPSHFGLTIPPRAPQLGCASAKQIALINQLWSRRQSSSTKASHSPSVSLTPRWRAGVKPCRASLTILRRSILFEVLCRFATSSVSSVQLLSTTRTSHGTPGFFWHDRHSSVRSSSDELLYVQITTLILIFSLNTRHLSSGDQKAFTRSFRIPSTPILADKSGSDLLARIHFLARAGRRPDLAP